MRRPVALVSALVIAVVLAGCGTVPPRTRLDSGLARAVLVGCLPTLRVAVDAERDATIDVAPLGWRISVAGIILVGSDDGSTSWSVSSEALSVWRNGAVTRFQDCVNAWPLDWSLARTDGHFLRAELYDYYRLRLMPCLRGFGVKGGLPSARRFASGPRFDPYTLVRVATPVDALKVQRSCPPAPLAVLAATGAGR